MQKIQLLHKTVPHITYYKMGAGPAMLLVHGYPANVHMWRYISAQLAKSYTLLMPNFFEQEGDWLQDGHTNMDTLASCMNDILEHEQLTSVLYAGHSMGGYMGLAFAAQYPQKLRGLSLIHSSALADDENRAEGRQKTIAILEKGGKAAFLKIMVRALFPEAYAKQHPEEVARQTQEAIAVNDQSLIAFYRAIMQRADTTAVTAKASFPVQQIIGQCDTLANPKKELAQQNLSFVNFVSVYQGIGHMAMLEAPDLLLKDLLHFASYCWRL